MLPDGFSSPEKLCLKEIHVIIYKHYTNHKLTSLSIQPEADPEAGKECQGGCRRQSLP